jgi:hypothetical protein
MRFHPGLPPVFDDMICRSDPVSEQASAVPYSGSSLVPMLVAGLALTLVGMIAAILLT